MNSNSVKSILIAFLLCVSGAAVSASTPLPANSVFQLTDTFTNQDGKDFNLASRRGRPQIVAMFYTSCQMVCPLIIDTARGVDKSLSTAEKTKLQVLFISMDPAVDTPDVLKATIKKRNLDATRWTLARSDDNGVRKIAALLGVRYRRLANGEFNHTSALYLLDADGRILAKTEKIGAVPDPDFLTKVHAALK
jgi:protein SCO1/2